MIASYAKPMSDLAKKAAGILKERGELSQCGKMCEECAFKWEQEHNLFYFLAADNAASILAEGGEFMCHTANYKCASHRCAGFDMIKKAYGEDYKIELAE